MEEVHTTQGNVERCLSCKGLWLDMLELEDITALAKEVDIGDPAVGATFKTVDRIYCPTCPNSKMLRMVDARQPHIWYESCPTCYGRYYDAGELTDLADHKIGDFFKRFRLKERI
jgi:Zn-finger nucleic acid-binding protein